MLKFKHFLIGREFTWITDCSGLMHFFKGDYEATHTIQRWKLELLRFDFTIVHRPAKMLTECDMLSRYNTWTSQWRKDHEKRQQEEEEQENTTTTPIALLSVYTEQEQATGMTTYKQWKEEQDRTTQQVERTLPEVIHHLTTTPPIPRTHVNPIITGPKVSKKTPMAAAYNAACTTWIIGAGAETATTAMDTI